MNDKLKGWFVELPPIEAGGFINRPPLIRPTDSTYKKFILYEDVSYDVGYPNSGDRITAEAGFITDFASIPRLFWSFYPKMGIHSGPAIIHDLLYINQSRTRAESDAIFLEALGVMKVPYLRRHLFYAAVRVGGWIYWNKRKKKLAKDEHQIQS